MKYEPNIKQDQTAPKRPKQHWTRICPNRPKRAQTSSSLLGSSQFGSSQYFLRLDPIVKGLKYFACYNSCSKTYCFDTKFKHIWKAKAKISCQSAINEMIFSKNASA